MTARHAVLKNPILPAVAVGSEAGLMAPVEIRDLSSNGNNTVAKRFGRGRSPAWP